MRINIGKYWLHLKNIFLSAFVITQVEGKHIRKTMLKGKYIEKEHVKCWEWPLTLTPL